MTAGALLLCTMYTYKLTQNLPPLVQKYYQTKYALLDSPREFHSAYCQHKQAMSLCNLHVAWKKKGVKDLWTDICSNERGHFNNRWHQLTLHCQWLMFSWNVREEFKR
jgi:hypothetical protein